MWRLSTTDNNAIGLYAKYQKTPQKPVKQHDLRVMHMNLTTNRQRLARGFLLGVLVLSLLTMGLAEAVAGVEKADVASAAPDVNRAASAPSSVMSPAIVSDWPQLQHDPQRTGYSPETLGTNFQVAWTHPFQPEKIYPQVQTIIYNGKAYIGTEMGNMYALNAATGAQAWRYYAGSPILATAAAGNGRVFFGAMDGAVYALDANTGTLAWKASLSWRRGFSTSPVLADNKVMLGGRNGIFYGLDANTGATLWQYNVGAPILQSAAWNNGRAFFGAMNMRVYAINTTNGSLAWQSAELKASKDANGTAMVGMAFKDYWPVVHQGKVIVRPMGAGSVTDLAAYQANPNNYPKTMFVFDEATGAETTVIHYDTPTMHGAITPPCVDRFGTLVVPTGGWSTNSWGRLSLSTKTIVDTFTTRHNNGDENENVSCSYNLIFIFHTSGEPGAAINGVFNLDTRTWTEIDGVKTNWEMSNNTQGGGGEPVSISNGLFYHIGNHELIVRSAQ